jgi:SAM-dependent methyltransferase
LSTKNRPESLEGRWDILYRDYPEVYEEFARIPKVPDLIEILVARFPQEGQVVIDVGSGTGLSTFNLAKHADFVIGIEIENAMLSVARVSAREHGAENVRFVLSDVERLALEDDAVDAAIGITLAGADVRRAAAEMERVVRPGGLVLRADIAPGWYGGELEPVITGEPRDETPAKGSRDDVLGGLSYETMDVLMDQDYGSVERAVSTYGFIHSKRVIDYIRAHNMTTIRWKFCVRFKRVT